MPDGTVSEELVKKELKTLPPDGYVLLRQLPYHEMLVRRDKGSIASIEQQQTRKRGQPAPNPKMILETLQTWEKEYMFKNCIAEHNIQDKQGNLLDFSTPMGLRKLRPDIGMEIERYIDELNSESEDGEFAEDFQDVALKSSEPQKQELATLPNMDSTES